MSLLSDLPDDILNLISIRLNGFDNCFLWMASDSKLRQRLVNNIITDFDINYTVPGRYLWPGNFLKKLKRLSRLSLVVDHDLSHLPIQNVELFPKDTLRDLKFIFFNSYEIFKQNPMISSNHSTGPTTSSDNEYINLNDIYPDLEHFEILTTCSEDRLISIDFVRFLPQKLKTLSMPETPFAVDDPLKLNTLIEILPRSLTSISLYLPCESSDARIDLSKLPLNLTSLTIKQGHLDHQSYSMILKSLKTLILLQSSHDVEKLSPYLPAGLENLVIEFDGSIPTSQMFTRLKHLESLSLIDKCFEEVLNMDDLIIDCPPRMKQFSCNKLDLTNLAIPISLFSNCLTQLELSEVIGVSAQLISSLPQSLTELVLNKHYLIQQEAFPFFSLLPRKLKTFDTNFDIAENISLLPESLIYLDLAGSCLMQNLSYFDEFPPKLETFMTVHHLPASIIKKLPPSLTFLCLSSAEPTGECIDDQGVKMLPRGLKVLSATKDNISDAGIADLPPSLRFLSLYFNTRMTNDSVQMLPRSLTQLTLLRNLNFTDDCIKHLPPQLTSLILLNATKITSKSCKDLPKYLQLLHLPICDDWDPEMLVASKNELPKYIHKLRLRNQAAFSAWADIVKKDGGNLVNL